MSPATGGIHARLEVLGEDGVRVEGADEPVDLRGHVGSHEPLVVARQRVGTADELLVETLHGVLGEYAFALDLAAAAEEDASVLGTGFLPLDRVDEAGAAVEADVEVLIGLRGGD